MNFDEKKYLPRLADEILKKYLQAFGAVSVEGAKWCGKTWTATNASNSSVFLDDDETFERASLNTNLILNESKPELIDEWIKLPQIWDRVRRKCDETQKKGNYILTCSTKLNSEERKEIFHSGVGRIGKLKMYPMSLYESKDSTGQASITDMYNDNQKDQNVKVPSLLEIAYLIIRGGWPSNLNVPKDVANLVPKGYIETILSNDINEDKTRDKNKMTLLLRSLARNESTIVSNQTIMNDIFNYSNSNKEDLIESRNTISDYIDILSRLNILENQEAYSDNFRSSKRVGKSSKRHFVDPSLPAAILDLTPEKLLNDLNTFGFLFESLVERDLKIYIEYLGGHLFHFRDNVSGLEVDSILEFPDGEYAAVEIKLGNNKIEEAKTTLLKFKDKMTKKPKFMCIITSNSTYVAKDPVTGIYILPITALKP